MCPERQKPQHLNNEIITLSGNFLILVIFLMRNPLTVHGANLIAYYCINTVGEVLKQYPDKQSDFITDKSWLSPSDDDLCISIRDVKISLSSHCPNA